MNLINRLKENRHFVALTMTALCLATAPVFAGDPPANPSTAPAAKAATDPLAPLAFLVGADWEAALPVHPDGTHDAIHAHFEWANNHRAIRISNAFVAAGKPQPYIDGIYTWHPGKKAIVFWYVDGEGNLYEGTVRSDQGMLVHEFQTTGADGSVADYTARVTPMGTNAWTNEIFARKEGKLTPMVKVRYERVK